jgi:hypothetical protein
MIPTQQVLALRQLLSEKDKFISDVLQSSTQDKMNLLAEIYKLRSQLSSSILAMSKPPSARKQGVGTQTSPRAPHPDILMLTYALNESRQNEVLLTQKLGESRLLMDNMRFECEHLKAEYNELLHALNAI